VRARALAPAVPYEGLEGALRMDLQPLSFSQHEFQPQLGRSVSIEQAAQLLGVSRRTVYYRIRDGRLRTIRTIGGSQRVLMDSVEEMRGSH
jgi:excisionase family DNA binding protein